MGPLIVKAGYQSALLGTVVPRAQRAVSNCGDAAGYPLEFNDTRLLQRITIAKVNRPVSLQRQTDAPAL